VAAAVCPICTGRGMIARGTAVQYCMCPVGRAKKDLWLSVPEDLRVEEEANYPTLPDLPQKTRDVA